MSLPKADRFREFLRRLDQAPPASSAAEALALLTSTLNRVEDELTNIPFDPTRWENDGRMYPPQPDSERAVSGRPGHRRYRSRGHNTIVGPDGSIEISEVGGRCILSKPGASKSDAG